MGETRVIALGQQVQTQLSDVVEALVGLQTCQTKGRAAFEREQIAGVANELCDDLLGFGLWRCEDAPRCGTWGGGRYGFFERTGQQTGHHQDACVAGRCAGFLTDDVADLLAYGFSQLPLEGCIGLGEGFGQVAQLMGLTKLIATVG
jgi:hypothetical protein